MSYTELYGLTKNSVLSIGETRNSWRGAIAIWCILEKKYLPKFIPEWAVALGKQNEDHSRASVMSDDGPIKEIWGLSKSPKLTKDEKIVLGSTFDNVLAKVESIDKLLFAFRNFKGETSLKEQADIIEKAIKNNPEIVAIGWNQTSVNGDTWANYSYDEHTEERISYNLEINHKHWFLVEEVEKS
jgi:hypothetical protein